MKVKVIGGMQAFDCKVVLVDEDGTEYAIPGVTGLTWAAKAGRQVSVCALTLTNVEIDAPEAVLAFIKDNTYDAELVDGQANIANDINLASRVDVQVVHDPMY